MQKGYKHSKETKEKLRLAALKRDNTKRIASLPKGKNHWKWSEKPNLLTLHKRIHRKFGRAKDRKCAIDGCQKMANDWASKNGKYTDNVSDYYPLCRSHHVKKDKNWIKKRK